MKSLFKTKNYRMFLRDSIASYTRQQVNDLFDKICTPEKENGTRQDFLNIINHLELPNGNELWELFSNKFCDIRDKLDLDAEAAFKNDPAAHSIDEIYLSYPGFYAIAVYRLSHELLKLGIPILPRVMSEYAHSTTGTDIHPGAIIGDSFFIDHATGIVIGETTVIHDNVQIFQGVTLGGLQVKKSLEHTKRHPTIESHVIIYANATILGGDVVVGQNSIIGANVCITESVPEHSIVAVEPNNVITKKRSNAS